MCGIAGCLYTEPRKLVAVDLHRVLNQLEHRGPDAKGVLYFQRDSAFAFTQPDEDRVAQGALLHRRLSILDLSEQGWQPMSSPDGRHHLVFNGEIYNYLELKPELEAAGFRFHSQADSEVLLYLLMRDGIDCLTRLVGMFAFAYLDLDMQTLTLARDPFGIKPLYYTRLSGGLAFASEITPLLEFPGVSRRANPQRVYDYLLFGLTDHGDQTMFADIAQMPAAHYTRIDLRQPDRIEPQRYWRIDLQQKTNLSYEQSVEQLRALFLESVGLHLRSDVPVGAALSGGIDSSAIVGCIRHLNPNQEIHTFSYIAEGEKINEERWVDQAVQATGATAHKIGTNHEEVVRDLRALIRVQGEPFGSTSIYAQHRVFALAKQKRIKVMLDGQGGDELLAGYHYYIGARVATMLARGQFLRAHAFAKTASQRWETTPKHLLYVAGSLLISPEWQAMFRKAIGKPLAPAWLNTAWFESQNVRMLPLPASQPNRDKVRSALWSSITHISLPHLLRYEDRNSMAFSIESRVPFLTIPLAEFLFSLPEEYLVSEEGLSKRVFREAMRGLAPDTILDRRDKIGFATPEKSWMNLLRPWIEGLFDELKGAPFPALKLAEAKQALEQSLSSNTLGWYVWRWINLIQWTHEFGITYE
ncbi:MAG: asparagine synthase (glutamine-hydrolyzing) [Fimbriimonadia bacterium]|nr:asparagine synthase (glutamine-hydrolyzing) [Fimbriimonadia bacterium]